MSYKPVGDRPMTTEHGRHREVAGSEKRGHSASVRTGQRARTRAGLGLHLTRLLSVQCSVWDFFVWSRIGNGNALSLMSVQSRADGSRLGVCGLAAHPSALWQLVVALFS